MKTPRKSKPVQAAELKQARMQAPKQRVLRGLMTGKFQPKDLVYNRNTAEDGAIRKVYEAHGATMYEVAVPMHGDAWTSGFCISDWAEDALQLSDNVPLKSATSAVPVSNLFKP